VRDRWEARPEGGDFVFSVGRDFVRACPIPLLVLAGNDEFHPRAVALAAQGWAAQRAADSRGEGEVSPATYNQRLAVLSSFYRYAKKLGMLTGENPIDRVERRSVQAYASAVPIDKTALRARLKAIARTDAAGQRDYALLAIYVRLMCPESPYWVRTQDRKRRINERIAANLTLSEDDQAWIAKTQRPGWRQLFLPDLLRNTVMATIVASLALVSYSTVGLWMPLFLGLSFAASQIPVAGSRFLVLGIAMLLSLAALGWPADGRIARRG
jgi:hypothetical protein